MDNAAGVFTQSFLLRRSERSRAKEKEKQKTERERAMICNIMSNERWRMIRGRFGRQQHPLNGNTTIIRETTIHNWVFLVYFDSWIVGG